MRIQMFSAILKKSNVNIFSYYYFEQKAF